MFQKTYNKFTQITNQVIKGKKKFDLDKVFVLTSYGLLLAILVGFLMVQFGFVLYETGSAFDITQLKYASIFKLISFFSSLILEDLWVILPTIIILRYFKFSEYAIILIASLMFALLHFVNGNLSLFAVVSFLFINLFHVKAWIDYGLRGGVIWHIFYDLAIIIIGLLVL